jgi:hypothetical protein
VLSDVGFGVAVLSAGVGLVIYLAGRSSERPATQAVVTHSPRLSAGAAGIGVSF